MYNVHNCMDFLYTFVYLESVYWPICLLEMSCDMTKEYIYELSGWFWVAQAFFKSYI